MRNKYKNKILTEQNIKEKYTIDNNLNSNTNKNEFKDVITTKMNNKNNSTIYNEKNINNQKKVSSLLNNIYNDLKIYKHAQIRKKLCHQSNEEYSPKRKDKTVQKTNILTEKHSIKNINNNLNKDKEPNNYKTIKNKEDNSVLIHVKKKNFEIFHKVDNNKRNNNRKNNYNISNNSQIDNLSIKSNDNLSNYAQKKFTYHGKIKSIMNKNNMFNDIIDDQRNVISNKYSRVREIKKIKSIEKKIDGENDNNILTNENSNYNKTESNSRILPNDYKIKKTYLIFPKKDEKEILISKTIDVDKKYKKKINTHLTYNYYQNTESNLTKDSINKKDKDKELTQLINNKENKNKNKKRNYIYINRRIRNIANEIKNEDNNINNSINKTESLYKIRNKPNKLIEIEVENGNSIKSPSDMTKDSKESNSNSISNNFTNTCLLTEKKKEIFKNKPYKSEYTLTHKSHYNNIHRNNNNTNNKIINDNNNNDNKNKDNEKPFQSFTFLVNKAHEIGQLSNSFGKFYIKGPISERNIQIIQSKNKSKNKDNYSTERAEKNNFIDNNKNNKKFSKKRGYSNLMFDDKKKDKKYNHNHNSISVDKKNINYLNNIINNNTYNTTVNFFKINQIPIESNKNKMEHKRASSNYSLDPKNLKIVINPVKKNDFSSQKISNSNSYRNINYIINTDLKEEDKDKEYNNIDLEILFILEFKLKNILNKLNNYEICYNECFEWINHYFNYNFHNQEIHLFKLNHNKNNIIYYIKIELLCYFLCYDVSFNKNFNQAGILLKTIFNLLHINYLILISFIISKSDKNDNNNNNNNNDNLYLYKLKEIIGKELKLKLTAQDMNENSILSLISNNFKEINNYYKMIIDNLYSYYYSISDDDINKKINKFPNCLSLKNKSLNIKQKSNIISSFFFDSYRLSTNYNFEHLKNFFYIYLYKSKESIYLTENNNQSIVNNSKSKSKNIYSNLYYSNSNNIHTQPNSNDIQKYFYEKNNTYNGGFYLPPIKSYYKYTLVLDLDETLVFFQKDNDLIYNTYNTYSYNSNNRSTLILRPGLMDFLLKMKPLYELVLFSFGTKEYVEHILFGTKEYVEHILSVIEKKEKIFEYVLYRHHATYEKGDYVKNLELLGRDLKKIIIVDDIPHTFKLQKSNGICIKPFYGDTISDRNTLKLLGKILETIRFDAEENDEDIRVSLQKQRNFIFTYITTNSEY